MALVEFGILNLVGSSAAPTRSIQYELEGVYTGIGLIEARDLAGWSGSVAQTDFYGYSAGSTIVVDFHNTITSTIRNASHVDAYRELVFTGRESGDVITINLESNFYEQAGSVILAVYYSINSTSSWNLILSRSATDTYDLIYAPGIDYNDVCRIRINIETLKSGEGDVTLTVLGGSFTSGSGTITASGTLVWFESVFVE